MVDPSIPHPCTHLNQTTEHIQISKETQGSNIEAYIGQILAEEYCKLVLEQGKKETVKVFLEDTNHESLRCLSWTRLLL